MLTWSPIELHALIIIGVFLWLSVCLGLFARKIIVDVSRLLGESVPGIEGIAVGVVVLVLDGAFGLFLRVVHLAAIDCIELRVVQAQIGDERCGDGAFSDEIFRHVSNTGLGAEDVVSP